MIMLELVPVVRLPAICRPALLQSVVSNQRQESHSLTRSLSRRHASSSTSTSVGTTTSKPAKRRTVTVFNDDGHVKWGDLSPMERAARTAQQSFNFGFIAIGAAATIAVFAFMYTDVFSSQSTVSHYNRAVDRIKEDDRVLDLLGKAKEIRAFGEPTWNKWRRNRPIASRIETDKFGTERLYMHFNLAGPLGEGVAHQHLLRRKDEKEYHYGYLVVDVPGHARIHVEGPDAQEKKRSTPGKFLGIRWT